MFGDNKKSVVVFMGWDPAADDDIPLWRAPERVTITGAYYGRVNALAAGTTNYFDMALYNGGTAGTALGVIAGTIGGTATEAGGTGGTPSGYAALSSTAFTISDGDLDAGELVVLRYNEEGNATIQGGFVQLDYVIGVGANA